MKKMTNAQFKAMVLATVEGMTFTEELTQEMFLAKLEVLTKAKAPSKKVEQEKAEILNNVLQAIGTEPTSIADIMEITGYTTQRVSAQAKKLVEEGLIEKIEPTKRTEKVAYKLA